MLNTLHVQCKYLPFLWTLWTNRSSRKPWFVCVYLTFGKDNYILYWFMIHSDFSNQNLTSYKNPSVEKPWNLHASLHLPILRGWFLQPGTVHRTCSTDFQCPWSQRQVPRPAGWNIISPAINFCKIGSPHKSSTNEPLSMMFAMLNYQRLVNSTAFSWWDFGDFYGCILHGI